MKKDNKGITPNQINSMLDAIVNPKKPTTKVQCMVCEESPIIELPHIDDVTSEDDVYCPSCEKWIATPNFMGEYGGKDYWSIEDNEYYDEDTGKLIQKDYPIKYIS